MLNIIVMYCDRYYPYKNCEEYHQWCKFFQVLYYAQFSLCTTPSGSNRHTKAYFSLEPGV